MDIFRGDINLRATDVTTLVSIALLVLRTVGQSFVLAAVWRSAMVLLQHEGLNLGQLNTMITSNPHNNVWQACNANSTWITYGATHLWCYPYIYLANSFRLS